MRLALGGVGKVMKATVKHLVEELLEDDVLLLVPIGARAKSRPLLLRR